MTKPRVVRSLHVTSTFACPCGTIYVPMRSLIAYVVAVELKNEPQTVTTLTKLVRDEYHLRERKPPLNLQQEVQKYMAKCVARGLARHTPRLGYWR